MRFAVSKWQQGHGGHSLKLSSAILQLTEPELIEHVNKRITHSLLWLTTLIGLVVTAACNEKSDSENFTYPANLTITEFSLSADARNPGLDSAYFSIDLQHGVIFNADSLRKGTKVNKVVPKITFGSTVSEAVIEMSGGTTREGEVDFQENPTDSIDFTGDVFLRLKTDDGNISARYRIKVNVHKENPDTLIWREESAATPATRLPQPKAMKWAQNANSTIALIEESDGSYSASQIVSMTTMEKRVWEVKLPFVPQVRSFNLTDENSWILAADGHLWQGTPDMLSWTDTGEVWESLIGAYTSTVVGISNQEGRRAFAQFPLNELNVKEIPEDFPISGITNLVTLTNKWTQSPVAFFSGGVRADGKLSEITWAFDGAEWIQLCKGGIPALKDAQIAPYYHYRPAADSKSMVEYPVWMLMGGENAKGEINRMVYVSYDNGVNWGPGSAGMQLPAALPSLRDFDALIGNVRMEGNLSDSWTGEPQGWRVSYRLEGDLIIWDCPCIYIFGGYDLNGALNPTPWRGVLNRLTFMPIL